MFGSKRDRDGGSDWCAWPTRYSVDKGTMLYSELDCRLSRVKAYLRVIFSVGLPDLVILALPRISGGVITSIAFLFIN